MLTIIFQKPHSQINCIFEMVHFTSIFVALPVLIGEVHEIVISFATLVLQSVCKHDA